MIKKNTLNPWWMKDYIFPGNSEFAIDIQWFAAEDEGRTEDPTEQKLRKSREEGKVAKSSEFTSAIVLLFPIITIGILGPYILKNMSEMMYYSYNFCTINSYWGNKACKGFFTLFY